MDDSSYHLPLSPNPYLIAVMLVTNSRSGPRVALCYPPLPSAVKPGVDKKPTDKSSNMVDDSEELGSESSDDGMGGAEAGDDVARQHADAGRFPEGEDALGTVKQDEVKGAEQYLKSPTPSQPHETRARPLSKLQKPPRYPRYSKTRQREQEPDTLDTLFGISRDGLAKLMEPTGGKGAWNAKKLEVKLKGRTFLGCPVFLKGDEGVKRTRKRRQESQNVKQEAGRQSSTMGSKETETHNPNDDAKDSKQTQDNSPQDHALGPDTTDETLSSNTFETQNSTAVPIHAAPSTGTHPQAPPTFEPSSLQSMGSTTSTTSISQANTLTMFNAVLVLAPLPWEHHDRIEQAYTHVVRPFAGALREAQKRDGWLGKEVQRLESLVGKWREDNEREREGRSYGSDASLAALNDYVIQHSHLYRTFVDLHTAISASSIAYLDLHSTSSSSRSPSSPTPQSSTLILQLPQAINTPGASNTDTQSVTTGQIVSTAAYTVSGSQWRGSFQEPTLLDTYDALGIDTTVPAYISPQAALLLIEDRETLLSQLSSSFSPPPTNASPITTPTPASPNLHHLKSTPLAQPLTHLLTHLSPRHTLHQIHALLSASLNFEDITALATLLIRLRVARAISPIHTGNVYVVNPGADLSRLPEASREFAARFGGEEVPSLPKLLGALSAPTPTAAPSPPAAATTSNPNPALNGNNDNSSIPTSNNPSTSAPRPLSNHFPPSTSSLHKKQQKDTYLRLLAHLLRGGWVVQLRTFARVCVSDDVRGIVSGILEREAVADAEAADAAANAAGRSGDGWPGDDGDEDGDEGTSRSRISIRPKARRGSDASASALSARTPSHHHPPPAPDEPTTTIDIDPPTLQARSLSYIGLRLRGAEARRLWPVLLPYLDGATAVEEIAGLVNAEVDVGGAAGRGDAGGFPRGEGAARTVGTVGRVKRKEVMAVVAELVTEGVVVLVGTW